VRTIEHLVALLETPLNEGDSIFGDDDYEPMKRWAKIFIAYETQGDWKSLVRAEHRRCQPMFRVLFGDVNIDKLPYDSRLPGFKVGDPVDEARSSGPFVIEAFRDWPDFLIALHDLFRQKNRQWANTVRKEAPDPAHDASTQSRKEMRAMADVMLGMGRQALQERSYMDAMVKFTMARRALTDAAIPSGRWYLSGEFAIASNRATCAGALGHWGLVRIDSRYILQMKPDHIRTYERLPTIAEAFYCPELIPRMQALIDEVHATPANSTTWKRLAQTGIGLLSLSTIIAARTGKLTDDLLDEMIRTGIEDMYTPINVGADIYPILPWLTETDLDSGNE
jgi:hypothetical protein